jgi:hypothetical protein
MYGKSAGAGRYMRRIFSAFQDMLRGKAFG